MKRYLSLLLLFFALASLGAQTSKYAATYTVKFRSGNRALSEQVILLMDPKANTYYSLAVAPYIRDSLVAGNKYDRTLENETKYDALYKHKVLFKNNQFYVYESVVGKNYQYTDGSRITWKLTGKKESTGNMTGHEAVASAFGRTWTAWYTDDIPINAGPYKFSGLPGFVYRVYDEKKDFVFSLTQFKKTNKRFFLDEQQLKKTTLANLKKIRYGQYVTGILAVEGFDTPEDRNKEQKQLEKSLYQLPFIE